MVIWLKLNQKHLQIYYIKLFNLENWKKKEWADITEIKDLIYKI